ncbi:MAG: hypothetical protein L6R37_003763 [Teloschistes peruensis]|nr:MAG: hypothetical protein L6R37_003763 [Teloschistes peruensis]
MSVQSLNARLQPLFDAHKQTVHLIQRLSKSPATPGSNSSDPDAINVRLELSTEIHQSLKEQEEEFELLRQEIEDQTSWTAAARRRNNEKERERTDLAAQVARLGEDLKIARSQFRKAQLQAKRHAEAAKRKERELLFASVQEGTSGTAPGRRKGQEQLSKDQLELNASADVTAALRRVHSLMQSEVSRSQFALETLHQSTAALSTLSESYTNLDTLLSSSRSLVSSLLHSQKSDTWYLETAFWILVATIGWLFFRRIIYGPGWWLLYLPTNIVWRAAIWLIHLSLGTITTIAGALGPKTKGIVTNSVSQPVSSIPAEQLSPTGELPTFQSGMSAPSIRVGGGGKGQPHPRRDEDISLSEKVGEMAEKTSEAASSSHPTQGNSVQETVLRERESDEPPNPRKRMWEEDTSGKGDTRARDEL